MMASVSDLAQITLAVAVVVVWMVLMSVMGER